MIRVSISIPQVELQVDSRFIRRVARTVLAGEKVDNAEISLAFVDNLTIQTLNRRYLSHDGPTDVLSFPLGHGKRGLAGELVIGAEVAKSVADTHGHDVQAELALYTIHGLLHLCGYNDETKADAAEMSQRERHFLRILNLPDIAPERS